MPFVRGQRVRAINDAITGPFWTVMNVDSGRDVPPYTAKAITANQQYYKKPSEVAINQTTFSRNDIVLA